MGAGKAGGGPIAPLGDILLRARPPKLSDIALLLESVEMLQDFHQLVEELLPEGRAEVLGAGGITDQVVAFAKAFGERYFPLDEFLERGDIESLGDLLRGIPIVVSGWAGEDYHALPEQPLEVVLASLAVDFEEEMGLEGEGIRITALEAAVKRVPQELLDRLPFRGYPLELLEQVLPGTRYEGLLHHALVLCHSTGSIFIDATIEDLWSDGLLDWSRENVDSLTEAWVEAEEIWAKVDDFREWLEEDPVRRFGELLDFLGGNPGVPPEQIPLPLELLKYGEGG